MDLTLLLNNQSLIFRAVRLEAVMPRTLRLTVLRALFFIVLVSAAIYGVFYVFSLPIFKVASPIIALPAYVFTLQNKALGIFLVSFGIFWIFWILDFYFLATARAVPFFNKKTEKEIKTYFLDFGGARRVWHLAILNSENLDLRKLYDFFAVSKSMRILPLRLGIDPALFGNFIGGAKNRQPILISQSAALEKLASEADLGESNTVGTGEFIMLLYWTDENFKKFLFDLKIREKELRGAIRWIASSLEKEREAARWWEREALGRIPGIGKGLGFGFTYHLDKYSNDISLSESAGIRIVAHKKEMEEIEEILSRSGEANVLLVGEEGSGKRTLLSSLARMIWEGRIMPALEHKRMVLLDTPAITAYAKSKSVLEEVLIKILNEAIVAGNIILVIDNFAEFLESASSFSVDAPSLFEPYFESAALQVIALADPASFHRALETNGKIMKLFQKVELPEPNLESAIPILENAAEILERRIGVIITYQAVEAAYDLADRFVAEGAMPEKAIDLLDRAASSFKQERAFMLPEDIERVIEESTKIPVGKVGEEESQKLLKLEEILHRRIVGQDEAIIAVANAMRRLRAGLHTGERPIGSFLFLGPTGVGKTETAKALAEAYFGSEKNMIRFDMSEFQGEEGARKLIGSFSTKDQGVLANALRQKPFAVLLFDEFEKSSKAVINLFLQILDEGFFSDAFGKKVSVRDAIIIATSNAGSNLIWDLLKSGKDPAILQTEVIDAIRKEGVFSPEILNRFDAIVVYHPLNQTQLKAVTELLLKKLAEQLKEQDIEFIITDDLIKRVAEIGYDPVMGARPMRRAIADRVEQFIARKILEQNLTAAQPSNFQKTS